MQINHLFISLCSGLFLYIVPCTGSCRRIRNSLSCRTICETICLSLFSNMGSRRRRACSVQAALCSKRAAAAELGFSTARCHHHHLVHLGEYFHGDHFWKILAFSRRNLRLFTFFRIPSALGGHAVLLQRYLLGLRKKSRLRKRKMRWICIQKYVCAISRMTDRLR